MPQQEAGTGRCCAEVLTTVPVYAAAGFQDGVEKAGATVSDVTRKAARHPRLALVRRVVEDGYAPDLNEPELEKLGT